jgi:hypothetical protein
MKPRHKWNDNIKNVSQGNRVEVCGLNSFGSV